MTKEIMFNFDFKLISKDNEKIKGTHGKYFLSKKYKNFENQVGLIARSGMVKEGRQPFDKKDELKMTIHAKFKTKVRGDIWNLPKSISDALQEIVYPNDKQIMTGEISIIEGSDEDSFRIIVEDI